jgi:hypothetical protein
VVEFVNIEMEEAGIEPFGIEFANPDFAKLAEAIGLTGIRVEDPSDVQDGVNRLLSTPGPALLDAVVEPRALSFPPTPPSARPRAFYSASPSEHCTPTLTRSSKLRLARCGSAPGRIALDALGEL